MVEKGATKTPYINIRVCALTTLTVFVGVFFIRADEWTNGCQAQDESGVCVHEKTQEIRYHDTETHEKEKYMKDENENTNEEKQIAEGLTQRDAVKIGHITKVQLDQNLTVDVITRSLKPLLFEIPNFLSDEECDHIIERAKDPNEGGMFTSKAKGGLTSNITYKPEGVDGQSNGPVRDFRVWDCIIGDKEITIEEIIEMVHELFSIIMLESDVMEMFESIDKKHLLDDRIINTEEFGGLSTLAIEEYIHNIWINNPRFKPRTSEQAWLFMEQWVDPTIHRIRERLVKLTGLSRRIIYGGERLQVVHYEPFGHYHAHHDSETHTRTDVPCCHQYTGDTINSTGECKLCRFITFIMYLNTVEEGGETAFPIADDEEYNEDELRGNSTSDKYNLSHGCKNANLIVKPRKGLAVLWYNHRINETDSWMGELDLYSLHGGCDVVKGEKWISNMWIPAPFGNAKHVDSIYLNKRDYETAVQKSKIL